MCYAIPGKLVEIKGDTGVIDYFGERRNVFIDFSDISIGDYVYAQGGILINKISPQEAGEILKIWEEVFFELKIKDESLAKVERNSKSRELLRILEEVNRNKKLTKDDLFFLFNLEKIDDLKLLYRTANNIRQKEHGNACCVHGIIEFSNFCANSCFYCGIRKEKNIERYRMSVEEIINLAQIAVQKWGFKALVLQSGEDYSYDENILITIVKELKKLNILIFLSIGERSRQTYKCLYDAGARGVLLRFETSNREIFNKLRQDVDWENRLKLIRSIKEMGFILATGFIIGLPQESFDDLINNILLTKELTPDMYSFGPLIPSSGTPLEYQPYPNKNTVLKTIAVSRLVDKNCNILVTTAQETLNKRLKREALLSGGNSLMINVTPPNLRHLYSIYDNRAGNNTEIKDNINQTLKLLYSLGRAPTDLGTVKN